MRQLARTIIAATALLTGSFASAEEPKRHPLAHVVHITASLTFDGKPVRIDDLIDCYASYTGTPTSSPHMVFKPNRGRITHEVPGGGMISFRVSRELCYVNGNQWGSGTPNVSVPEEWVPVLEWYDNRDVLKRTEGILYLSETALKNPKGRLKINEPFSVTTPMHPPSAKLIDETNLQASKRRFTQNHLLSRRERINLDVKQYPVEWMLRISEEKWRNPQFYLTNLNGFRRKKISNFNALSDFLDGNQQAGITSIGSVFSISEKDASSILLELSRGQRSGLIDIFSFGVPFHNTTRYGLLLTERAILRQQRKFPYYPNRFDDLIPLKCIDGILTADLDFPGLRYWYNERCSHPTFYRGNSFFDEQLIGTLFPTNDRLLFDTNTNDLWWIIK